MEAARIVRKQASVNLIPLAGPFSERSAEVSGMAWHGNELLVLPQYGGKVGLLPRDVVNKAVDAVSRGQTPKALEPTTIDILPKNFEQHFHGFQGFEAVAVAKGKLYFLVEAKVAGRMVGYLVAGERTSKGVELDLKKIRTLPVATTQNNLGYEALSVVGERLVAMPELNGRYTNPISRAKVFDLDLNELPSARMPVVDYRVTDATDANADGEFWVSNYNHPGEEGMPAAPGIERLVPLKATSKGIVTFGDALDITENIPGGRNWEAVVPFEKKGFLLMTDMYPHTLLGFVATDIT
jgi:hypothetical protein